MFSGKLSPVFKVMAIGLGSDRTELVGDSSLL